MTAQPTLADWDRINEWLAEVQYKPGCTFTADLDPGSFSLGISVHLDRRVPNAYDPAHEIPQRGRWYVPPFLVDGDKDQFHDWLWCQVKLLEIHEAGEWFVVSGERPHDPHKQERPLFNPPLRTP